ncbi:22317_t:CDS:10 [Rhizophagus irregularis]|nr:22317_t:CDS:10 [Rhizophagus irregularis]
MDITKVCTACGQIKLLHEFIDFEAKNTTKQYHFSETEKDTNSLEVVEVTDFFDYIAQLLNIYTTQAENEENIPPFHFECKIIEEADEFSWMKSAITYWYFCSQRHDLAAKSKKHPRCFKTLHNFNFLHLRPANVEVFQDIKNYIKEHIDLLLREIYAQLVSIGLDLSIHQKQIQFWWSKLEENKYKHHENAFKSTIEWLNQENYNTRLEETITVHAVIFTTGLYKKLNQKKTLALNYTLEMNGTEFPLAYLFDMEKLCDIGIQLEFLLSDKDFAQLNAARFTWRISKSIIKKFMKQLFKKCLYLTNTCGANGIVIKDGLYGVLEGGQVFPIMFKLCCICIVNKSNSTSTMKIESNSIWKRKTRMA